MKTIEMKRTLSILCLLSFSLFMNGQQATGYTKTRNYTAERTYMDASSQTGSGGAGWPRSAPSRRARPDTGSAPAARWHRGRSCRSHRWQPVRSPTKCADRLCRTAPSTPCGNRGQLLRFS